MDAKVVWKDGMAFESHLDGFNFTIDSHEMFGGRNLGPMPKGLLQVSVAGCTAMDVVSMLGKMRVKTDYFEVDTDAVLTPEHPKKYESITVKYIFKGENLPLEKIKHAVTLSIENYCGVLATLKPVVKFSYEIIFNGEVKDSWSE